MCQVDHADLDIARSQLLAKGGQVGRDASLDEKVVHEWDRLMRTTEHLRKDDADAVRMKVRNHCKQQTCNAMA